MKKGGEFGCLGNTLTAAMNTHNTFIYSSPLTRGNRTQTIKGLKFQTVIVEKYKKKGYKKQ